MIKKIKRQDKTVIKTLRRLQLAKRKKKIVEQSTAVNVKLVTFPYSKRYFCSYKNK